jgi:hypothetical protein
MTLIVGDFMYIYLHKAYTIIHRDTLQARQCNGPTIQTENYVNTQTQANFATSSVLHMSVTQHRYNISFASFNTHCMYSTLTREILNTVALQLHGKLV